MSMRELWKRVGAGLVLTMLLGACASKPAQQPVNTGGGSQAPTAGKEIDRPLYVATDVIRPETGEFNPLWTHTLGQVSTMNLLWMGMGKFDENYTPKPWLVKSWNITPDCSTVKLDLYPEARWSDGTPITAADFEFTWRLYLHKDIDKASSWVVPKVLRIKGAKDVQEGKAQSLAGVKIINDYALEVSLEPSDCMWLADQHIAVAGIQPKHVLEPHWKEIMKAPYFQNPTVTSGPYKFVKMELDTYIEVQRWDDWWGNKIFGQPKIKRIFFKQFTDQQVQHAQLEAGEVHVGWIAGSELDRFKRMDKFDVIIHPSTGVDGYFFNLKRFKDSRVLQAFDYALDKQSILKIANFGVGRQRPTPIMGPDWAVDPSIKPRPYDVDKAKALLKDANYDTSRKLKFILTTPDKRAELFQAAMKQLGIDVEINVLSAAPWREALQTDNYDVSLVGGGVLGTDPSISCSYFASPSIWADSWQSYKNPRFNELCKDVVATSDQAKRKAASFEMQKILFNDLPWIMIGQMETIFVVDKRLGGFKPTITSNRRAPDLLLDWYWKA